MAVLDRQDQRAHAAVGVLVLRPRPAVQRLVDVVAGRQQRPRHVGVPLAHREEERVKSRVQGDLQVCAPGDESLHDPRVALGRGPHQGRLLVSLGCVWIGPAGQQGLNCFQVAGPRRGHQRGLPAVADRVCVRTGVEQQLHQICVAAVTGKGYRLDTVGVRSVDVCPCGDKRLGHAEISDICRPVQCRRAVGIGRVHVGAAGNLRPHPRIVTCLRSADQVSTSRRRSYERQQRNRRSDFFPPHCSSLQMVAQVLGPRPALPQTSH